MILDKTKKVIDSWVKKYPKGQQRSAVKMALRLVQDDNKGYLTEDLMDAVAAHLDLPPIAVYEVATFYSFFNLKPIGKHKIAVCSNLSCMLRGSNDMLAHLEKRLNIKAGQTTVDGRYTLINEVECLGACGNAPMMQLDDKEYIEDLTFEKLDKLLNKIDKKDEKEDSE